MSGANSVTILFSNATSFINYRDISGDAVVAAGAYLERASKQTYESLGKSTWQIFVRCFRGCSCIWAKTAPPRAQTSASRVLPKQDPTLLALYYEFGRYLLISSSRPGGQPANLQGIWNQDLHPALEQQNDHEHQPGNELLAG